jgi:hypothetical protein
MAGQSGSMRIQASLARHTRQLDITTSSYFKDVLLFHVDQATSKSPPSTTHKSTKPPTIFQKMDQLKGALGSFGGGDKKNTEGGMSHSSEGTSQTQQSSSGGGGGFLGGLGEKFNSAAGGGKESEKNEDYLDKGEFENH